MTTRIFDKDYDGSVHVTETADGIELLVDEGDRSDVAAAIPLDDRGIRALRLALAAVERKRKAPDS